MSESDGLCICSNALLNLRGFDSLLQFVGLYSYGYTGDFASIPPLLRPMDHGLCSPISCVHFASKSWLYATFTTHFSYLIRTEIWTQTHRTHSII